LHPQPHLLNFRLHFLDPAKENFVPGFPSFLVIAVKAKVLVQRDIIDDDVITFEIVLVGNLWPQLKVDGSSGRVDVSFGPLELYVDRRVAVDIWLRRHNRVCLVQGASAGTIACPASAWRICRGIEVQGVGRRR
jgi:hypothetical protein